jgi:hypothetical protein
MIIHKTSLYNDLYTTGQKNIQFDNPDGSLVNSVRNNNLVIHVEKAWIYPFVTIQKQNKIRLEVESGSADGYCG